MDIYTNFIELIESILPKELAIMVLATIPYLELKGAIPIGLSLNLSYTSSFFYAFIGSIFPSPFIIYGINKVLKRIKKRKKFNKILQNLEDKLRKKGSKVKNLKILGLFIFVSIPLPGTGVWTGSLLAGLFNLNSKRAIVAIILGNFVSGIIISILSLGLIHLFN